jgi:hypothetical protein
MSLLSCFSDINNWPQPRTDTHFIPNLIPQNNVFLLVLGVLSLCPSTKNILQHLSLQPHVHISTCYDTKTLCIYSNASETTWTTAWPLKAARTLVALATALLISKSKEVGPQTVIKKGQVRSRFASYRFRYSPCNWTRLPFSINLESSASIFGLPLKASTRDDCRIESDTVDSLSESSPCSVVPDDCDFTGVKAARVVKIRTLMSKCEESVMARMRPRSSDIQESSSMNPRW